eukprot:TRINITY_DN4200_c0_g2_i1.p1 TRINITY_DN4200_c0_g2~~TRINITY_DN4200_c0_g2_i1.p1  ORF type:complete len:265 (-),score=76.32 TRINITY_DN4200_c0_g2_i1:132-926(-)
MLISSRLAHRSSSPSLVHLGRSIQPRVYSPLLIPKRDVKVPSVDLKKGMFVVNKGKLLEVQKTAHHRMGRGHAFMNVDMVDTVTGAKSSERFRAEEKIECAEVVSGKYTVKEYKGKNCILQEQNTFESITLDTNRFDPYTPYLREGQTFVISMHDGNPISIQWPRKVIAQVKSTRPAKKGASVTTSTKPAELTNGRTVKVPFHVEEGTWISVSIPEEEYTALASESDIKNGTQSSNEENEDDEEDDDEDDDDEEEDEEEDRKKK